MYTKQQISDAVEAGLWTHDTPTDGETRAAVKRGLEILKTARLVRGDRVEQTLSPSRAIEALRAKAPDSEVFLRWDGNTASSGYYRAFALIAR